MTGLLRIKGTLSLDQFWPDGNSDADTSKIKVTVGAGSFAYAADGKRFRPTSVFAHAQVRGKSRKMLISKDQITVRLQGIDATELHYRAGALASDRADVTPAKRQAYNDWNAHERRQYWAESATLALAKKLASFGRGGLPCTILSYVDAPHEVADTYGRVVGNVRLRGDFDVNLWLTEQGWAFPTFYSSMSETEIKALLMAARKGKRKNRLWPDLSDNVRRFNAKLLYRKNGVPDAEADMGAVIMPKLFRRQVAFQAEKAAKLFTGSFKQFLARTPDECCLTDAFLAQGVHSAPTYTLDEFVEGSRFTLLPDALVFKEKPASLVDARTGKRLDSF
jgi:endonuclease YncB( thermonuclease family)